MGNTRGKLCYAVRLAVEEICRTSKRPTFATFTIHENIQDAAEARRRWRCLEARLKRAYGGDLRGVGVWQQQGRGAWHFHWVCDRYLDVVHVRAAAVECGFGQQMRFEPVGKARGFRQHMDVQNVVRYITRYIVRDLEDGGMPKGFRPVQYTGPSRVATVSFGWVRGMAKLYRLGRDVWSELHPGADSMPTFADYWIVVRYGWESLTGDEKRAALMSSDVVARWWLGPELCPF